MYRILVPIDTNTDRIHTQTTFVTALPNADEDVRVTVLHVSKEDVADSPDSIPGVEQARTHLENEGVEVHVTVRVSSEGSISEEILAVAEETDADQIVMAGRKRAPTEKVIFGSVTQSVLLNTETPVTITGHV